MVLGSLAVLVVSRSGGPMQSYSVSSQAADFLIHRATARRPGLALAREARSAAGGRSTGCHRRTCGGRGALEHRVSFEVVRGMGVALVDG